ncbi:unnamed protein product [Effrenium voratum]|nr:unnamed protein product [Effrenium voratum]
MNALQLQRSVQSNEGSANASELEAWSGSCAAYGCGASYNRHRSCQCNSNCKHYRNCCYDYDARCHSAHSAPAPAPASKSSCSAIPSCAGLGGECCPTKAGMYLGCCPESMIPHAEAPPPRFENGRSVMTVYHQTSPEACQGILATGFRIGHDGWCGGAIYFAMTPEATKTKAITPHSGIGCMLEAKVNVGHVKKYPCCRYCGGHQDQHIAWTKGSLKSKGYDSIVIDPGDGPELVIYDNKQVMSLRVIPFNPAWTPHRMHGNW